MASLRILLLQACTAVVTSATLFPTASPTITEDPYECATESLTDFFKYPRPTGDLESALWDWAVAREEENPCTFRGLDKYLNCPVPGADRWCDFASTAPASVLPAWSEFGSSGSSWWSERSSTAVVLAEQCPWRWYYAVRGMPGGSQGLNLTILSGECLSEPHDSPDTSATIDEQRQAPTTAAASPGAVPSVTAPPVEGNGIVGRAGRVEAWMGVGIAMAAAAAVNMML